ncbi:unnamed protein product [Schistosoma curassoni]|uniref:Nagb/rpia/CoA transferase-like protein n=1 Tax=Schistosoma curassoni TaxID=6186 RepID=A0A183KTN8_9TREM|nr:unnamed protein product [Schistosoma curassoni]
MLKTIDADAAVTLSSLAYVGVYGIEGLGHMGRPNRLIASKLSIVFCASLEASNHQCGLAVALNEKSLPPPPEFIKHREELWNKLKREYDGFVASQPRSPVQITLPDGTIVDGKAWETTPMEVAKNIR